MRREKYTESIKPSTNEDVKTRDCDCCAISLGNEISYVLVRSLPQNAEDSRLHLWYDEHRETRRNTCWFDQALRPEKGLNLTTVFSISTTLGWKPCNRVFAKNFLRKTNFKNPPESRVCGAVLKTRPKSTSAKVAFDEKNCGTFLALHFIGLQHTERMSDAVPITNHGAEHLPCRACTIASRLLIVPTAVPYRHITTAAESTQTREV